MPSPLSPALFDRFVETIEPLHAIDLDLERARLALARDRRDEAQRRMSDAEDAIEVVGYERRRSALHALRDALAH